MHQIHSQEVVQMNTQATESKAKEVWEAEQASAHTLSQVKTKTTSK